MHLEGSCHCGSVKFSVEANEFLPFMRCYCSICRKTAGTGGYAINIGADHRTMKVTGKRHLRIYRAMLDDDGQQRQSTGQRHFCGVCGSALWMWDPTWPDQVHPHAGAIDTPLPVPPANVHASLDSKSSWVRVEGRKGDERYETFPDYSLKAWHEKHAPQNAGVARAKSRSAKVGKKKAGGLATRTST
jgi:hypothetical protein